MRDGCILRTADMLASSFRKGFAYARARTSSESASTDERHLPEEVEVEEDDEKDEDEEDDEEEDDEEGVERGGRQASAQ